jgi:hypothetical protein
MNLAIKSELEEFNPIGMKNRRRILRRLPQTAKGKVDRVIDASRHALPAGKRISKNGKIYWESRQSRSDSKGSNI